jgi:uncharacterized membrane protein
MHNLNESNDPSNWKWGVIYYNKNDKRVFVPKRSPRFGWTINAGNKYAVLGVVALSLAVVILICSQP